MKNTKKLLIAVFIIFVVMVIACAKANKPADPLSPTPTSTITSVFTATVTRTATLAQSATNSPTLTATATVTITSTVTPTVTKCYSNYDTGNYDDTFSMWSNGANVSDVQAMRIYIDGYYRVNKLQAYLSSVTCNYGMALYRESGVGYYPGLVVCQTSIANNSSSGWVDLTPDTTPVIAPGYYWLVFAQDGAKLGVTSLGGGGAFTNSYYSDIPMADIITYGFPEIPGDFSAPANQATVPMLGITYYCP